MSILNINTITSVVKDDNKYWLPKGYDQWYQLTKKSVRTYVILRKPTQEELQELNDWGNNEFGNNRPMVGSLREGTHTLLEAFKGKPKRTFPVNITFKHKLGRSTDRVCLDLGIWYSMELIEKLLVLPVAYTIKETNKELTRSFDE